MSTLSETRAKAYKKHPFEAAMTDFMLQHERKLKRMHKAFMKDTGEKIHYFHFVEFIYFNGQNLVLNPEDN